MNLENSNTSFSCNGPENSNTSFSCNGPENSNTSFSCNGPSSSSTSPSNEPPLPMQTSSLFSQEGLDITHGRGGNDSPNESSLPPSKRRKLSPDSQTSCFAVDVDPAEPEDETKDDTECSCMNKSAGYNTFKYTNMNNHIPMVFDILDELESSECEEDDASDLSSSSDSDYEIDIDEIDAMLDESLKHHKSNGSNEDKDLAHEDKEKVILKVRGRDHFDVLPEGWIEVTHNSGMPIYLHKQSRVCSMSKPYFLGPGSARKHEIPISAIPCLHYAKELEKEKREAEENSQNSENEQRDIIIPSVKLECVEDSKKEGSLDFMAVRDYCQKRFEFKTITVKRFKTWFGRRKHLKQLKQKQRPTLPEHTKLITCPLPPAPEKGHTQGNPSVNKKEFVMNPSGKSAVCILHEYVQHSLRVQPRYVFKELENASTPYGAVVVINNMEYGFGFGSSKKQAKSEAAKSALGILIPKMRLFSNDGEEEKEYQDVEFFDQVRVEDPRVCELCIKAGQPYPYQILLECLKRNYGMGNTDIHFEMKNLKHQKNEFIMTVGKHKATVICKNKRDGKQRASQAILQMLHPQITCWGSLLRMYGIGSRQTLKEKKVEEQRITELQSKACANKPNLSILNKLKEEILKYRKKKESMKPIGKLIPEQLDFLSTSDSNLKNVEL